MTRKSARAATFDALFRDGSDPWSLETSDYEREKRSATIAALGPARFSHILEIGCATGVLTQDLAPCCDRLTAIDVSSEALDRARKRLSNFRHVELVRGDVPADWPRGSFDAIIFSEVLYFLTPDEITAVSRKSSGNLASGGTCLLVNWTGENDCEVDGSEAVDLFAQASDWVCHERNFASSYRLDRFGLKPAQTAAD